MVLWTEVASSFQCLSAEIDIDAPRKQACIQVLGLVSSQACEGYDLKGKSVEHTFATNCLVGFKDNIFASFPQALPYS